LDFMCALRLGLVERIAPAKEVLSGINRRLADRKLGKPVNARTLANAIPAGQIPQEMRDFLLAVEVKLGGADSGI
jgi:hypothetical protein